MTFNLILGILLSLLLSVFLFFFRDMFFAQLFPLHKALLSHFDLTILRRFGPGVASGTTGILPITPKGQIAKEQTSTHGHDCSDDSQIAEEHTSPGRLFANEFLRARKITSEQASDVSEMYAFAIEEDRRSGEPAEGDAVLLLRQLLEKTRVGGLPGILAIGFLFGAFIGSLVVALIHSLFAALYTDHLAILNPEDEQLTRR